MDTISDMSECKSIENHFSSRSLFGGIFIGFPFGTESLVTLAKKGYNIVLVDQLSDTDDEENKIKRANTNNLRGGFLATDYLIQRGHKKILHVSGDDRLSSYERAKGYVQAMKQEGISETPIIYGYYRENIAYEECKRYL